MVGVDLHRHLFTGVTAREILYRAQFLPAEIQDEFFHQPKKRCGLDQPMMPRAIFR